MNKYFVKQYQKTDYTNWNAFIGQAKNATFLFHRDFMEYHKDRFEDFSLMIFETEKLVAVLPANRVGDAVYSHQGLTYGGLVYSHKINGERVEGILDSLLNFLKENLIKSFYFKPIPLFYSSKGNAEMDFFVLKKGAFLDKKEMNLAINLVMPLAISKSKLKHFRKIEGLDLQLVEEARFESFWELVLEPRLLEKYNVKPVHTLQEITKLKENFPNNIKQYSVYYDDAIIAGVTIFETENVVKSQYGATSKKGEELRALDFLFISLIEKYKREGKFFFDMGIVNDDNEKGYHAGLLKQKEELGCSVYSQDFYKMNLI
ncbi:GNAT family N-acetyltransferase [Flavobacterium gawalongense]|uniref:GNAT family N-acetyltransferase n=1 Tax=Flavobacterium gawalongense TaxID=2594432 RepID=A0A553BQU1_9FLAO|nr:GNAT family N-acetyltransferase [Flavobacterium gawalongense]TRX00949.1 GNAT family N-acetyltransferase [Flavobacterium gawalongense]TRX05512.1 GNAT family N-acetyltransferase [Flavobacterium gawalongense]TRX10624.1 GNAT family N-acetyltransferase [Flavobacterium gawalongense]TRX11773.1 GNAT family N-acetyltransferase [Flavobacterium gawalongense]TRX29565.1 GNAT family N-acetyltransferase [Flavobacterium gawalongense]